MSIVGGPLPSLARDVDAAPAAAACSDHVSLGSNASGSCRAASVGSMPPSITSISQRKPPAAKSKQAFLNVALTSEVPKPRRVGAATGGPPLSCHLNFSSLPLPSMWIVHDAPTFPPALDNAPYLAALVASSCSASEKLCASLGPSTTLLPSMMARPANGSSSRRTISPRFMPLQFDVLSCRLTRASAYSRASNAFLACGSEPS